MTNPNRRRHSDIFKDTPSKHHQMELHGLIKKQQEPIKITTIRDKLGLNK